MRAYRTGVLVFGVVFVALGIALVVRTATMGGGTTGYLIGLLFAALGMGRIYLLVRR